MLNKIVVIGPESTGKSTLCHLLAQHFNCLWCKEFARDYLLKHGNNYNFKDLAAIAQGQLSLEDEYTNAALQKKHPFLFLDTDMYVMQVWCNFVFKKVHSFIEDEIKKRTYTLYILCNTDVTWVKDELREYPDLETRQQLFNTYHSILKNQNTPFVVISGQDYEERLQQAIAAVTALR